MARGGTGEVFRALARGADGVEQAIAIKRILPMPAGSSALTERFVARASMMTRLAHPNIVKVLDFGVSVDGDFYLMCELVQGTDLGRLCKGIWARGESVPVPVALYLAAEVLKGLGHAHERSAAEGQLLVHQDVSPGNVIVSSTGAVKIADFGVAIALRGDAQDDVTRRDVVGKPSYMPPEQFDGHSIDARADVFSLGVVLFQTLTGSRPFSGTSAATRMAAARDGQLLKARELRGEVSEELEALLARALAPRRDDRFPNARAMLEAIEELRDAASMTHAPDDLAHLVAAVLREPPESRSTARPAPGPTLGSTLGLPSEPIEDDDLVGCELIRSGALDPFTLHIPERRNADVDALDWNAPLPSPSRPFSSGPPPSSERSTDARSPLFEGETLDPLVHGAPAPLLLVAGRELTPLEPDDAPRLPPSPGASRAPVGGVRQRLLAAALALTVLAALALVGLRTGQRGAAGAEVARFAQPLIAAAVQAAVHRSSVGPTAAARAAALPASAPQCEGDVRIEAAQAWRVAGGPAEVGAPGRYRWPCGSFSLRATSGADPSRTTEVSVTVARDGTAVVDLR